MKKPIRIIKRKDAETAANAELQSEPKPAETASAEALKRSSRREMTNVVSNWILRRAENNRAAEVDAVRRFFGSESFSDEV